MTNKEFRDKWKSSTCTRFNREKKDWEIDPENAKETFEDAYWDKNGVLRWKSNNNIPPSDCLSAFAMSGILSWEDAEKLANIEKKEQTDFLVKAYKNLPQEWDADPEILAEARQSGEDWTDIFGSKLDVKRKKWIKQ